LSINGSYLNRKKERERGEGRKEGRENFSAKGKKKCVTLICKFTRPFNYFVKHTHID
jgi:hypothetical protein